jgi:hypothetical protein
MRKDNYISARIATAAERAMRSDKHPVIGRSNGHEWIIFASLHCCKTCGIVRRTDDQNKPCKGPVKIAPREK